MARAVQIDVLNYFENYLFAETYLRTFDNFFKNHLLSETYPPHFSINLNLQGNSPTVP